MSLRDGSLRLALVVGALVALGGACSSFGEERPDATDDGGVPNDTGTGGDTQESGPLTDGATCGCETPCLFPGAPCLPYEPATGLPADMQVTALAASSNLVFLAGQQTSATLWRIPVPKEMETSAAISMATTNSISDIALSADDVIGAMFSNGASARVLASIGKTKNGAVAYSPYVSERVAANDAFAYGATDDAMYICPLASISTFSGCVPRMGITIDRLAAAGTYYCIHGAPNGSATGIYCAEGSSTALVLRAPIPAVEAFEVRGGRVYWSTANDIGWAGVSGNPDSKNIPISGVTALALEGDDLFYTTGTTIVRCDKTSDCPTTKRDILTSAANIQRFALSERHVYFVHTTPGGPRLARVPRKP